MDNQPIFVQDDEGRHYARLSPEQVRFALFVGHPVVNSKALGPFTTRVEAERTYANIRECLDGWGYQ